jgi:hypothetical protein
MSGDEQSLTDEQHIRVSRPVGWLVRIELNSATVGLLDTLPSGIGHLGDGFGEIGMPYPTPRTFCEIDKVPAHIHVVVDMVRKNGRYLMRLDASAFIVPNPVLGAQLLSPSGAADSDDARCDSS